MTQKTSTTLSPPWHASSANLLPSISVDTKINALLGTCHLRKEQFHYAQETIDLQNASKTHSIYQRLLLKSEKFQYCVKITFVIYQNISTKWFVSIPYNHMSSLKKFCPLVFAGYGITNKRLALLDTAKIKGAVPLRIEVKSMFQS